MDLEIEMSQDSCEERCLAPIEVDNLDYQIKIEELAKEAAFLMQYSKN